MNNLEQIKEKYWRVYAEVDLDAIRSNILKLKKKLKEKTAVCAVIKADGYGHGAVPVARYCDDLIDFIAVATIDEAVNLRNNAITKPVLVLGYTRPSRIKEAIDNDIRLAVINEEAAVEYSAAAAAAGGTVKVHIAIDSGMSRVGFLPANVVKGIKTLMKLDALEIEGIFTHFYDADSDDNSSTRGQLDVFKIVFNAFRSEGRINIPLKHCANSAAVTNIINVDLDMVRLGISMYGLYPSEFTRRIKLTPALSLKSHVIMTKWVHPGTTVGYGAAFTTERETNIATVPVGYADGYMRSLSGKGYVLIRGRRAPVIGRICMDMFMADVTDIEDVCAGDEVVLIGEQGEERITMEEISSLAGSFNYEFACDIGKRVPKIYYAGGEYAGCKDYFFDKYDMIVV